MTVRDSAATTQAAWLPRMLGLVVALATVAVAAPPSADQQFEQLSERYLDEFPALSPVSATLLGDHRFDGKLAEVGEQARRQEAAFYRRYLDELSRIQSDQLSRANQVDATLLEHQLRADLWQLEELRQWAWNPLVYIRLTGSAIYGLMARDFAPLRQRLNSAAMRLEQFPRLLRQIRQELKPSSVPKIHAETAVKQNRGVLSILTHMVEPRLGSLPANEQDRLREAIKTAGAAIDEHQQWLEKTVLPKADGSFRIGAETFDKKLAFRLHSGMTRAEIRRRAESELRRVRDEMYSVAKGIYRREYEYTELPEAPSEAYQQAIIRAALEVAYRQLPPRDKIVETAREQLAQTTEFVRQAGFVSVPDNPVEIIVMPEFQRGVSLAYCDSPGPLDAGQKTFYAVAPLPQDWTEQQVKSFLREYNVFSLQNLTVHEAMPGHYLQIAHSNRYPSTLRAVLSSGVFIEGWAVYGEHLMVEHGYLDSDPLMHLVVLKWYLRGIANALMDQAIHAGSMTRDEAMKLMVEDTFQEEREAAAKWVRAQLTSAQLSTYFVGFLQHLDMRNEAKAAWGAEYSDKRYHDTALSFGSPPVPFVRALLLDLPIPQ